jgi:hypothetical protein
MVGQCSSISSFSHPCLRQQNKHACQCAAALAWLLLGCPEGTTPCGPCCVLAKPARVHRFKCRQEAVSGSILHNFHACGPVSLLQAQFRTHIAAVIHGDPHSAALQRAGAIHVLQAESGEMPDADHLIMRMEPWPICRLDRQLLTEGHTILLV